MLLTGCGGKKQDEAPSAKGTEPSLPGDPAEGPSVYHAALGDIHLRYGFSEKAVAAFRRACAKEEDPEEKAKCQFQLGRAYLELGNLEEALHAMQEAIGASKSTDRRCDIYLELAKTYVVQERWREAKHAYRFVANNSRQGWQKRLAGTELNSIYTKTEEIDDVIGSLEQTIERNPQDDEARLRLAEIFTTTKPNLPRAIELYEAIYKEGKLSATLMERLASLFIRVGAVSRAQRIYEKLIEMAGQGRKNRYRLALAQVLEKANELSGAQKVYETVLERNPSAWESEFAKKRLYSSYEKQGSLGGIIAGLEKRATENPGDAETLGELSEIYAGIGNDPQKAIAVTERLLLLKPGDSTMLQRVVDLYEKSGQKEKAIEVLKSLLSILPNAKQPAHLERIARLYSEMGNADEALDWIGKLTASDPNDPGIHARAALLYLKNSRKEECLAEYEKAIALSTSAEQRDALRAQLAQQLVELGDYARAEGIYELLVEASVVGPLKNLARQKLAALHVVKENDR